jgi:hypothetical protein
MEGHFEIDSRILSRLKAQLQASIDAARESDRGSKRTQVLSPERRAILQERSKLRYQRNRSNPEWYQRIKDRNRAYHHQRRALELHLGLRKRRSSIIDEKKDHEVIAEKKDLEVIAEKEDLEVIAEKNNMGVIQEKDFIF